MVTKGLSPGTMGRALGTPPLLHVGDGLVVARVGLVCTAIWRSDSTLERVQRQGEALAQVVRRAPGQAGFMCIVEESSAPPNEEARKASARMMEEHGEKLRAAAMVIEGAGFRVSIVRSVASSILWLARRRGKTPISYFSTVEASAKWLADYVALGPLDGFIRDVALVRAVLDEPKAANG